MGTGPPPGPVSWGLIGKHPQIAAQSHPSRVLVAHERLHTVFGLLSASIGLCRLPRDFRVSVTITDSIPPAQSTQGTRGAAPARKLTVNFPAFTSNPPQLHHQKTTSNHPFSPKPPAKTGSRHPKQLLQKRPQRFGFLRGCRPTRANSPATENAPGMFQNPSATKFLWRTQLRLWPDFMGIFTSSAGSKSG
jgi:hypothetical protein